MPFLLRRQPLLLRLPTQPAPTAAAAPRPQAFSATQTLRLQPKMLFSSFVSIRIKHSTHMLARVHTSFHQRPGGSLRLSINDSSSPIDTSRGDTTRGASEAPIMSPNVPADHVQTYGCVFFMAHFVARSLAATLRRCCMVAPTSSIALL